MAVIYRTAGAWGAGKGANLEPAEVDENFYTLVLALAALELEEPIQISSITVEGNILTVHMENGTTYPVEIPIAAFRWRGDWQAGTDYEPFDIFVTNDGLYFVLQDYSPGSDDPFDPDVSNMTGPLLALMIAYPTHYDIGFMAPGKPGRGIEVDGTVFAFRADRDFFMLATLPGSVGGLEHGSQIEMVFPILKNETQIGTFTIGGDLSTASEPPSETGTEPPALLAPQTGVFAFAADVQFNAGDRLRVLRPDTLDTFARDLSLTFLATRGLLT